MPKVAFVKACEDKNSIREALLKLFSFFGGLEEVVPESAKYILIKPNICFPHPPSKGTITSPLLVEELCQILTQHGKRVAIGEASAIGNDIEEAFAVSGYQDVANRLGVKLLNFQRSRTIWIDFPQGRVLKRIPITEELLRFEYIINVAKFKTHAETVFSGALKNIKGLTPRGEDKVAMHMDDINWSIVDMNRCVKPDFHIIDGINALGGLGPSLAGEVFPLGIIGASPDPVALDAACCRIAGIDLKSVKYIGYAAQSGLGSYEDIELAGDTIPGEIAKVFPKVPASIGEIVPYPGVKLLVKGACSSCISALAYLFVRKIPQMRSTLPAEVKLAIVAGGACRKEELPKCPIIVLGNCARKLAPFADKYVPGCPPQVGMIAEAFKKIATNPKSP